jgi:uncharacterized MAPEG superfamily protein
MRLELWLLLAAILLGFFHIVLQALGATFTRGIHWNAGPRDEVLPPLSGKAGRLERALRNYLETFPLFAAAVLTAAVTGIGNFCTVWGAILYLGARIAYVPLYVFGVRYVRSFAWIIAAFAIVMVLFGVAEAAF